MVILPGPSSRQKRQKLRIKKLKFHVSTKKSTKKCGNSLVPRNWGTKLVPHCLGKLLKPESVCKNSSVACKFYFKKHLVNESVVR